MKELEQAVRAKFPFAIMSGSLEAGEGEHKIFTFLKTLPASSRQQIGIYGLDADLILICLAHSQLGNIKLVRETGDLEVESEEQYATLNIAELARKIDIPIQQYVALCMLCFGNDFMPNLGMFSLREGGYERACEIYQKAGNPDLLTFEGRDAFLTCAGKREFETLKERIQLRKRPEEKAILGKSTTPELFSRKYGLHVLDGVENMAPVVDAFWKTFHWSVDYFMNGVPTNWDWYYPYPDAPLIMDILKNDESPIPAPAPLKYTINDQLQFILPSASLHRAKKRVIHADEMYGETRELWMKRHDWEAKPRISLPWNVANTHSPATK
jgi:5'-3' exonuclease